MLLLQLLLLLLQLLLLLLQLLLLLLQLLLLLLLKIALLSNSTSFYMILIEVNPLQRSPAATATSTHYRLPVLHVLLLPVLLVLLLPVLLHVLLLPVLLLVLLLLLPLLLVPVDVSQQDLCRIGRGRHAATAAGAVPRIKLLLLLIGGRQQLGQRR